MRTVTKTESMAVVEGPWLRMTLYGFDLQTMMLSAGERSAAVSGVSLPSAHTPLNLFLSPSLSPTRFHSVSLPPTCITPLSNDIVRITKTVYEDNDWSELCGLG